MLRIASHCWGTSPEFRPHRSFALSEAATAAAVLSFSFGMQAGITAVNALLGVLAGMVAFRTRRPFAAIRVGIRLARA